MFCTRVEAIAFLSYFSCHSKEVTAVTCACAALVLLEEQEAKPAKLFCSSVFVIQLP